ncbi:MAG TPA: O-antigen ligase family protein [Candidatus Tectomicrobia bacterium]|nr:O-antigen ligase family protein [Candidatus Tectomicrobia bacterium]
MYLRTAMLPLSEQPVGRVIDVAIVAFLLLSVLSITGAQAAILFALAAWFYGLLRAQDTRPLHFPLLLPIAAFYLASVLASVTAVDPYHSVKDLRNVFLPAFFILLVNHVRGKAQATALLHVLIPAATVMAVYGLTQSITQGPSFRVHGTMSIYMTFAGILMLIALMVLAQVLFTPRGRLSYALVGSLGLLTAALVMTHTRGAWMGFAAGAILILGFRQKRLFLALPVLAVAIFLAAPEAVRQRISSIVDPQDVTARERLYMWSSGLRVLRDYPWTGVGMEGVKRVYPTYKHPEAVRDQRAHLHSNPIQIAAERGLIGLACWLWIWIAFYSRAWKIVRSLGPDDRLGLALVIGSLASVTGFQVAGLFEYTFGDSEVVALVYFFMALPYIVEAMDRRQRMHGM